MKDIVLRKIFVILATGHYIALSERVYQEVATAGKLKCPVSQYINLYDMFKNKTKSKLKSGPHFNHKKIFDK